MSAFIYIEGGSKGPYSKEISIRCQEAFSKLLDKMGFQGRKPRLKACGGRQNVYDDFRTAHAAGKADFVAMLIDSEDPMTDIAATWEHLQSVATVPQWGKPLKAKDTQVLFMTTCMETWILADRATLRSHYGSKLCENPLLSLANLEDRPRHDVQNAITQATRNCTNAFRKGERSYAVFGKLNPEALKSLPSFVRVAKILNDELKP